MDNGDVFMTKGFGQTINITQQGSVKPILEIRNDGKILVDGIETEDDQHIADAVWRVAALLKKQHEGK